MSQLQSFDPAEQHPLYLLPAAVKRLHHLLEQQPSASMPSFRVYVTGGGCSGFQYGFKFDETTLDEDTSFEQEGIHLLVDSLSIQYLEGSQINFEENLIGSQFSVINPNATTQCSCGSSFSI